MDLNVQEARELESRLQQVADWVTLNRDGTFACRRRYDPVSTPEQFLKEIEQALLNTGRRGKIDVLEKKVEGESPFFVLYFLVRFRPLT